MAASRPVVSLATIIGLVAHIAGSSIDADTPFMEAGLNSLGMLELARSLPPSPSPDSLAMLTAQLSKQHASARSVADFLSQDLLSEEGPSAGDVLLQAGNTALAASEIKLYNPFKMLGGGAGFNSRLPAEPLAPTRAASGLPKVLTLTVTWYETTPSAPGRLGTS